MEFVRSSLEQVFIIPKAIFRLCFIIVNNAYCIPTYVVWMILLLPLRKINPEAYWRLEGYFFHWLLAMVSMWSWSAGYDIVETGDDISECLDARTLVLSNHQSTADVPMLMACFNARRHVLPNLMWIMDSLFKYTNFGIVSVLHQDFFIMSGKEKRNQSIQALTAHILTSYIPRNRKWMVLFPEGGFLRKRRANSQLYADKHQLPVLQHVTLPRVGAMTAIMESLGPNTDGGASNSDGGEGGNSGESGGANVEGASVVEGEQQRPMNIGWRRSGVMEDGGELLIRDGSKREERAGVPKERGSASRSVGNVESAGEAEADPLLATTQLPSINAATSSPNIPLATQLAFILDITIAYPNGPSLPLDLKAIIFGHRPSCRTTLLYRLYKCSDSGVGVPKSGPELTNWLFSRWQEKDRLLAAFYRNGRFPSWYKDAVHHTQKQSSHGGGNKAMEGDHSAADSGNEGASSTCDLRESGSQQLPMPATLVSQDCLRFIILHLFFITSTYVHVLMFLTAYEYAAYFIFH